MAHLRDVPDAAEDPVAHARRPAGATGDLVGGLVRDLDAEDPGRAADDRGQLAVLVIVEPERDPEAVAQRRGEKARARRRADERERRQLERESTRGGSLAHHDVEPEVLERRVEDLLGGAAEAVDLVDEEDVARLDGGQDRGDVLSLEGGPRDRADPDTELLTNDVREAGLAEPRRPDEENVVERFAAALRRVERDRELLLDAGLANELVEPARPEALLDLFLVVTQSRRQELRGRVHAALFNASRTRSSGGRPESTSARARSASSSDQPSSTSASRATTWCSPEPSVTGTRSGSPSFSFSSRTMRSAVFLPMPGIAWNRAESPRTIARRSSATGEPETIASATFGPIPLTARSWTNSSRSLRSAKP